MKINAPLEDRLLFYKFQNAMHAFGAVSSLCDYFSKTKMERSHSLYIPLTTSLAILYARPFKQRKNIKLPQDIIPAKYKKTHDFLILMRDKVVAHTDTEELMYDENNRFNDVVLDIENGYPVNGRLKTVGVKMKEIKKVKDLCEILREKCKYHSGKIWDRYMKNHKIPDGDYRVNIDRVSDNFLIKQ